MPRKQKPLIRDGEPSETTREGVEVPIPKRDEVFGLLGKAIGEPRKPASRSGRASRRTSRDR